MIGLGFNIAGNMVTAQRGARLIPTLAGSQYGTLDTPITFTGDFEVEVEFATTSATLMQLVDGSAATLCRISMNAGVFTMFVGNGTSWIVQVVGTNTFNDGKLHIVKLSKSGNDYALYVDGISEVSLTTATAVTPEVTKIGAQFDDTNLFIGELLSVKFTDAGTVVANYVFDSGSDLYQLPRGSGLGSELSPQDLSTFDSFNGTDNGTDGLIVKTSTNGGPVFNGKFTVGKTYIVRVTGSTTATNFTLRAGSGGEQIITSALTGSFDEEVTFTATHTHLYFRNEGAGDTTLTLSTAKQLPDLACLLTNFATTDWNRYTLQRNIVHDAGTIVEAWVGDNIAVNGAFDADTDWIKGVGWTIGSGVATYDNGVSQTNLYQNILTLGDFYLLHVDLVRRASGSLNVYLGSGNSDLGHTAIDTVKFFGAAAGDTNLYMQGVVGTDMDIDNVSARKVLEVA